MFVDEFGGREKNGVGGSTGETAGGDTGDATGDFGVYGGGMGGDVLSGGTFAARLSFLLLATI